MIYPMIITLFLITGCTALSKPEPKPEGCDLSELIKAAHKAGCKVDKVSVDKYLETCSVECK